MIPATQLRIGAIVKFNGDIYRVTYIMHRTPGNKRGFVQAKLRSLANNKVIDNRFASDDKIENLSLDIKQMQYLYAENDKSSFHFMDNKTFDQVSIRRDVLEEFIPYLKENENISIGFHEHEPVTIELPETMDFKIVTTAPEIKGSTATTSFKPAELDNGITVMVPPFVKEGDVIRIKTESSEYLERV